jgi:glycosyltransferase involved in cell wall biosynthesis
VPAEVARLRRVLRAFDPDLVHLHSSKAGLAGRLALRGRVPTVFQPHAWSFAAVTGPVRAASLAWERLAVRWADVVVCVSEAECADGRAAGVDARYAVVENGVDLAAFAPSSRGEARAALGLRGDRAVVVCVGRLSRQKGQDVLLAAARGLDADVWLVGEGPDEAALRAAAPPNVSFAGRRDDVAAWYAAADVVAVPSRWEGMALAALEALACGRPVVASDVTGMRASDLVPADDAAALRTALAARLADPGDPAAWRALTRDLRETTAEIRAVYDTVLA